MLYPYSTKEGFWVYKVTLTNLRKFQVRSILDVRLVRQLHVIK